MKKFDTTAIVPIYRKGVNDNCFTDPALVEPDEFEMGGLVLKTNSLRFGVMFDLLGLAMDQGLIDAGEQDCTDMLSSDLRINTVCLRLENNEGKATTLTFLAAPKTIEHQSGNPRNIQLSAGLSVDIEYWGTKTRLELSMAGSASADTGLTRVTTTCVCDGLKVTPLGYTLVGTRYNPNRRS